MCSTMAVPGGDGDGACGVIVAVLLLLLKPISRCIHTHERTAWQQHSNGMAHP
jgi:hypothetical protein